MQQDYERYSNMIQRGNKTAKQKKPLQILIFFLMREIMRSNLLKIMVQ